jgi:class 3 adenylate cyclase
VALILATALLSIESLPLLSWAPFSLVALTVTSTGALIASRQPRHPIGWIFCAFGLFASATPFAGAYGVRGAEQNWPGALVGEWLWSWGWLVEFTLWPVILLLFPDGRLPSPRWRFVAWAVPIGSVLAILGFALSAETGSEFSGGRNPFAIDSPLTSVAFAIGSSVLLAALLASILSLVVRLRRASGVERQQLKWVVFAAAVFGLAASPVAATDVWTSAPVVQIGFAVVYTFVPASIGIAILRYRLYDIDLIVNRALVYGGATLVLAGAFGAANVATQRMLEGATGARSEIVTALLAVGAALAFGPVRRRLRPLVDRFLPARAELALLFTDIVGSTRIAAEIGDARWRSLLDRYRTAVRRELGRFDGREIDTAGDSFFATFDDPAAALQCAWRIRHAVRGLGLESRTGVHFGECEMRGQVSGLAVHTAARVMAAAPDGEVVVSDALRAALNNLAVQLADHGVHRLKGVPGEWRLYRVAGIESLSV